MNKVEKKLAEIKSLYGLGDPVYSNIRIIEEVCLFLSRWRYRLTTELWFKLKYKLQSIFKGYNDLDKWNFAWYISRKAIPVLEEWKSGKIMGTSIRWHREDRFGNIIELTREEVLKEGDNEIDYFTEEEWRAIIDDILYSFKFINNEDRDVEFNEEQYNENFKRYKRGMKLLSIYFMNLWD